MLARARSSSLMLSRLLGCSAWSARQKRCAVAVVSPSPSRVSSHVSQVSQLEVCCCMCSLMCGAACPTSEFQFYFQYRMFPCGGRLCCLAPQFPRTNQVGSWCRLFDCSETEQHSCVANLHHDGAIRHTVIGGPCSTDDMRRSAGCRTTSHRRTSRERESASVRCSVIVFENKRHSLGVSYLVSNVGRGCDQWPLAGATAHMPTCPSQSLSLQSLQRSEVRGSENKSPKP